MTIDLFVIYRYIPYPGTGKTKLILNVTNIKNVLVLTKAIRLMCEINLET